MITEAVQYMGKNKASGPDGIGVYHLQNIDPSIIYNTINEWAQAKTIPMESNSSEIIPIHKNGDTKRPENYRPIALINTIIKLYELTILNQIDNRSELISETQYGAVRGRSAPI